MILPGDFEKIRAMRFDPFQRQAMSSVSQGHSVLVAAPTGSGKTAVAEYAVARALSIGKKAFYTTPLKALSNQKYADFAAVYGPGEVGLLTGDVSVNGEMPVVVMTTEVLRNMIYESSPTLSGLACVILDEVHYLQNPYRGGVWEEVIVQLPVEVALVCLSATVSNVEEFGEWLSTVRGATDLVIEERRPVNLENLYMAADRRSRRVRLLPTFVKGRPNPDAAALDGPESARMGVRGGEPWKHHVHHKGRITSPSRIEVVEELSAREMLPAIYFVFSRDGCERAAISCLEAGIRLTTSEERETIREIAEAAVEELSDRDLDVLGYGRWLACLEVGIAAHHAGLVPPFKEAVEACFALSLVKAVFATETLSLGINMPARSVVIEKLSKFTGERHEHLTPGEYTQFTGRAGRRGLDEVGYGVVLWSPVEPFSSVASLASARSFELKSSFRPTYNMAANLIRTHREDEARGFLNLSFAQFRSDAEVVRLEAELRALPPSARRTNLSRRIDSHTHALSRTFDRVTGLLAQEGYLSGWALTAKGERLSRIYHESDLLVSEVLEAGLFDGLEPADLAAVVSSVIYEPRLSRGGPGDRPAGTARQGRQVWDRFREIQQIAFHIATLEEDAGLPATRPPDSGFASMARRWTSGADLAVALGQEGMPPGDFVRNIKQLLDLLRQVSEVSPVTATREAAAQGVTSMWRGVVALANPASLTGSVPR